jgi:hypothetical protein
MTAAPAPLPPALVRRTAYLLFLLSGLSGLLFETLWTYQATLALGSSYWAVTAVLSAFMAGLALGNFLALRRSVWTLRTYAVLEGVILLTGFGALLLLPGLGRLLAPLFGTLAEHPALLNLLRLGVSFTVLAVPSTAMGMTLPALVQALADDHGSFRAVLGRLYGLNTLGAVAGVLLGEIVLLPRLGVLGTGALAAALNAAAALGGWGLSRSRSSIPPTSPPSHWERRNLRSLAPALVSVFLAGFALLGLEIIWTRLLALFIPNNSLAFALMLATVLSGIALGGIVGSASWIARRFTFLLPFGTSVALVATYTGFALFPRIGTDFGETEKVLLIGLSLQFPVSFLSGVFFTLAGAEFRERISSSQASAGLLVLFNTAGAAAGAIVAGLLLVPGLGVEHSILVMAILYGVAAVFWYRVGGGNRRALAIGAAICLAGLLFFPRHFLTYHVPAAARKWSPLPDTRVEAVREGLTETVLYLQAREFGQPLYHRMITNSFSMSATTVPADRYMRQFVYWPVALHPAPKRALLICFGVGNTASALVRTRELEHIDVVDISRDILELSRIVSPDPATHPLKDPRVKVHVEDGRFFLQTRPETWDIITGEPPPPENAGVAGLYSQEYFRLLKERLSPGGIATYWLPLYSLSEPATRSILKAWSDTFETCFLWRGSGLDLMLVGFRGTPSGIDERRFRAQWRDPATLHDLTDVGLEVPEALGSGFVGDGDYLRSLCATAAPAEDAFPKRIASGGPREKAMVRGWYDRAACADRFGKSRSVADLWPPDLRERTLSFFKEEQAIEYLQNSRFPDFERLHRLCTGTTLKTPLLWVLNSDRDYGRAAQQCEPEFRRQPLPQYHLGVAALADRDFARASDHFLRTVGMPGMRRLDLTLCLYTLCMAGRKEEAERTLAGLWPEARKANVPTAYWDWMKSAFGFQIPAN